MDLKELRYFRAIAQHGTFSKAAAHLRVAQPALSRQIQKLEHSLGVQLLRRTSRGVTPTEAGQVLLQRTLQLEQELEETRREVARFAERATGALRLGVQSTLSMVMVPEIVKAYRAAFPGVAMSVTEGFSGDLIDALLDKRLDVAIIDAPSHAHAELNCSPLWVESLQLVFPADDATLSRFGAGPVPIADLARLPIIMPCPRHGIRRLVDAAFERHHLRFQPELEANGAGMIFALVKAGIGYTLMPSSGFDPFLASGELRAIPIRPAIRRTIGIVVQTGLLNDRPVAELRMLVKSIAPRIAASRRFGPAALYLDSPMPARHGAATVNALEKRRRSA